MPSPGYGQVAEWLKAADCKSVPFGVRRFESYPVHHHFFGTLVEWFRRLPVEQEYKGSNPLRVAKFCQCRLLG